MAGINDLDLQLDLEEKPLSKLSVMSERHETYKALVKWPVPKSDIETNLSSVGGNISSKGLYVGSHYFYLTLYPNGKNESLKGTVSVTVTFATIPENTFIEGEISVNGRRISEKFSSTENVINIDTFDKTKNLRQHIDESDLIIHCSMKIMVQEVKCKFGDETVQCNQSRKIDSYKEGILYKHKRFSDVTFQFQSGELQAHKAILAELPYFQKLFDSNVSIHNFDMSHIKLHVFEQVLHYVYTGGIPELDFKLACELYITTNEFEFFNLFYLCSSYLGASLTVKNVFIVIKLSHKCNDIPLKKRMY